jgi:hypothetical protein
MTWGATLIVTQAEDWGVSINYSSTSMNYGILLQGFGGIFAVPFIEAYGRYLPPVHIDTASRVLICLLQTPHMVLDSGRYNVHGPRRNIINVLSSFHHLSISSRSFRDCAAGRRAVHHS